jgi:hypothetical protein
MIVKDNPKQKKGRPPGRKLTERFTLFLSPRDYSNFTKIVRRMNTSKGKYLRGIIKNLIESHIVREK